MNLVKEHIKRKSGRNHGEVFTHDRIVDYLLSEVNYKSHLDLRSVQILEPSSGTGSFAIEIIKRLFESSLLYGFSFIEAFETNVRFVELNEKNYSKLVSLLQETIFSFGIDHIVRNSKTIINGDFLTLRFENNFDCIVGNPPYIRNELISNELKELYKSRYETFKYRADLYVLFFERSLQLLNKNGVLSFICSNRWLYNQYGQLLRDKIAKSYHLHKLLNMEKASPFDESVLAYPSITTIINNRSENETLFYETDAKDIDLDTVNFSKVPAPKNDSWQNLFLKYNLEHYALTGIINQNFEIGIGVATGADKVFIIKETEVSSIEESRLLPIVTSRDLTDAGINWKKQYLLNPYENGILCDLNRYPNFKQYLESQKEILLKRHTAQKNPSKWYKTIDNIKPNLIHKPKLLLPDIAGLKRLIIDEGNYYPHHNLYYIIGETVSDLKILACILMSDFIREQLSQIGICMNGGLPRFQAQTLKKLRIPNISTLDSFDKFELIEAYDTIDYGLINKIIIKYCTQHRLYAIRVS
jgi:hypothetical protein